MGQRIRLFGQAMVLAFWLLASPAGAQQGDDGTVRLDPSPTVRSATEALPLAVGTMAGWGHHLAGESFQLFNYNDGTFGSALAVESSLDIGSLLVRWLSPTVQAGAIFHGWMYNQPADAELTSRFVHASGGLSVHAGLGPTASARIAAQFGGFVGDIVATDRDWTPDLEPRYDYGWAPGLYLQTNLETALALTRATDLYLHVGYHRFFGLEDFWRVGLGVRWMNASAIRRYHADRGYGLFGGEPTAPPGPHMQLLDAEVETVFPVLFRHYADAPFGTVRLSNISEYPIESLQVRFLPDQYSGSPKLLLNNASLQEAEEITVDLTYLFADEVLAITEGTEISGQIEASYVIDGFEAAFRQDVVIPFYDRNSVRWDDDNKVATFVTAKDEEVQRFAKRVAGMVRREGSAALTPNFQMAMAAFEALNAHGTAYVIDPASSYEDLSKNATAVDYVQFPRQTLQFRAGDCDDLSVTYNALLESVSVETAFVTIPGHIFAAAKLELTRDEVERVFADPGELIIRENGSVWLPVELTVLDRGFREAWAVGARQWREHAPRGDAGFYPTHAAWERYSPVGFSVGRGTVDDVPLAEVADRFSRELTALTLAQIRPQVGRLEAALERQPDDERTINRLGALYARYGLFDEAREHLEPLVSGQRTYLPALVNIANIDLLEERYEDAVERFQRALNERPDSSAALVGLMQASNALGEYAQTEAAYETLNRLDAELAASYGHLVGEGSGRASEFGGYRAQWEDEE